jgi:hypothetical protein
MHFYRPSLNPISLNPTENASPNNNIYANLRLPIHSKKLSRPSFSLKIFIFIENKAILLVLWVKKRGGVGLGLGLGYLKVIILIVLSIIFKIK